MVSLSNLSPMSLWPWWRKLFWGGLGLAGLGLTTMVAVDSWMIRQAAPYIVTAEQANKAQVAIVLGAFVNDKGYPSPVLQDRIDQGIELYRAGKVDRLLMSGDHGQVDYDEVNGMRTYAEKKGVPSQRIFLDHAGFSTFETMVRARKVFQVESAIVVTNQFHLARSVFLARSQGIQAQGVVADKHRYFDADHFAQREFAARAKAFLSVYVVSPDVILGPVIPITGDAAPTHDKN